MESGDLFCPNCHSVGMNKYLYYESNNLSGVTYWIFYNTKEQSNSWKCWWCCEAKLGLNLRNGMILVDGVLILVKQQELLEIFML